MQPETSEKTISLSDEEKANERSMLRPTWQFKSTLYGLSIIGLMIGSDTGEIGNFMLMDNFASTFGDLHSASGHRAFSTARIGLIVSLLSIGNLIGAICALGLVRRLGVRKSLFIGVALFNIGTTLQASARTALQLIASRLMTGLSLGLLICIVPRYQSEAAPAEIRGYVVGTFQLAVTCGIFYANVVCLQTSALLTAKSWILPVSVNYIWAILVLLVISFVPENPRWLLEQSNQEDAKLAIVARYQDLSVEQPFILEMISRLTSQIEQSSIEAPKPLLGSTQLALLASCFTARFRRRIIIGMSMMIFQQCTGASFFLFFGGSVFKMIGFHDPILASTILGAINFVGTFPSFYLFRRFGRRRPLIIAGLLMAACHIAFAIMGLVYVTDTLDFTNVKVPGTVMIAIACVFITLYASTVAGGAFIIVGESFPSSHAVAASTICNSCAFASAAIITFSSPILAQRIGFSFGFVFAGLCLSMSAIVYFLVYESNGLTVEQVDLAYSTRPVTARESGAWAAANRI